MDRSIPPAVKQKQIVDIPNLAFEISVPKRIVIVCLASFYTLAFIITPYWMLVPVKGDAVRVLIAILFAGAVWSAVASADIRFKVETRTWILFAILLLVVLLLNFKPLTSVIPWRGDEDYHIKTTLNLMKRVPAKFMLLVFLAFCTILYAVLRKSYWLITVSGLVVLYATITFFQQNPFKGLDPEFFLRYPFISYWFFALPPKIASLVTSPYHEVLFRFAPALAAAALSWAGLGSHARKSFPAGILWGLSIAVIPILFYYSSILYLEQPAALLMTIVCLNAGELLSRDFNTIKRNPAWYALVMIGFIKETTLTFLICFLLCRTGFSLIRLCKEIKKKSAGKILHHLMEELAIAFCILFPALLYLTLRTELISVRSFVPDLSGLTDPTIYGIIGWSFIQQFGLFLFFFLGGWFLLLRKKEYRGATFIMLLLLFIPLFHTVDTRIFAGYSRFNLFVLPSVLAGSAVLIDWLTERNKKLSTVMACCTILLSFVISPVHADGTKVPFWGNYLADTSEHYYPYDTALAWLKEKHAGERILFSDLGYKYYFEFYFSKLDWFPEQAYWYTGTDIIETEAIRKVLSQAELENIDEVLFRIRDKKNRIPRLYSDGTFCIENVFRNQAHVLVLFSRGSNCMEINE